MEMFRTVPPRVSHISHPEELQGVAESLNREGSRREGHDAVFEIRLPTSCLLHAACTTA